MMDLNFQWRWLFFDLMNGETDLAHFRVWPDVVDNANGLSRCNLRSPINSIVVSVLIFFNSD